MEKRFIQFLKDEGVYDAFVSNLKQHHEDGVTLEAYLLRSSYAASWVSSAFIWMGTPEDHKFWRALDKKWQRFCGILSNV